MEVIKFYLLGIFETRSSEPCEGPKPKLIKMASASGFLDSKRFSTLEQ